MGVRVKVRLETERASIEAIALANIGYETIEPEIVVPIDIAKSIGLFPLPKEARLEEYMTTIGRAKLYYIPEAAKVSVISDDRIEGPIIVGVTISSEEEEVLLGDKALDALKIALEEPGKGLWRFVDERRTRKSAK